MGKKRQTQAKDVEQHDEEVAAVAHAEAAPAADAAQPTTPREQSLSSQPKEGGERASNASETPRETELPATPVKEKACERVTFPVDELALERNKLFQLAVFLATLIISAVLVVYRHALVKPKVDAALQRGTDFARQIDGKYSVVARASDYVNYALEELEEYAAWRQVIEPRLQQARTVAGHLQTRVVRYFQ